MKNKNALKFFYIIAFSTYPILALRQVNINYVHFSVIIRSLALVLVFVLGGFFLLRFLLKDWHKAGILTALGSMLFFSYGHIYLWALESSIGRLRHRTLIITFLVIFGLAAFFLIRQKSVAGLARFLNVTGAVMIGWLLIQSIIYGIQVQRASQLASENSSQAVISDTGKALPDIYLIILDAHTRSDVLLETFEYDNSEFIESLEGMGFYVADCSQSNYPATNLSLISLMNLDYFYNLFDEIQTLPSLKRSVVSETLRDSGYTVVAFENYASGHFDLKEDVHLSRNSTVLENVAIGGGINEFESMLIETSFLRIFVDMPQLIPAFIAGDVKDAEFYEQYLQTRYILKELENLPDMPGPKFVMAHILVPHDPFIFSPDGSYQPSGGKGKLVGYRNNVSFIDNFMPKVLQTIIEKSEIPPIIIVQGDHGFSADGIPEERMAILNAYYLKNEHKENLYPTITPVNSFRVIFNAYFDTDYPILPDHSYFIWNLSDMLSQDHEIINFCHH